MVYNLSVIIPVYKAEQYVAKCVQSLLESTLAGIELIFVDDCSPDNSVKVIRETISSHDRKGIKCTFLSHTSNRGIVAARETGVRCAEGKYIAFCDADDRVQPDMYEKLYTMAERAEADLVYCGFFMEHRLSVEECASFEFSEDKESLIRNLISYSWTVVWNLIVRRNILVQYDWTKMRGQNYCEDFHLLVWLFQKSRNIRKVCEPLYYYNRCNNESVMHHLNSATAQSERICYSDTIDFLRSEGIFSNYEKEMGWRVLKCKQDLVLSPNNHEEFMQLFPFSHKYIASCPFCNKKIKVMMWLLTHQWRLLLLVIIKLRKFMGR